MVDLRSLVEEVHEHVLRALVGPRAEPRSGIADVLCELISGHDVILSAPPGYGKTMVPYCAGYLAALASGPWPPRAIHVLPLRSIIDDCYRRLFEDERAEIARAPPLVKGVVARQSLDEPGSPWLQRKLVLTTLDTFTMCAMRLPPAELRKVARGRSIGHGFLSRAAIIASSVIFDEIHLFIEEGGKMTAAFSALIWWLSRSSTPVAVMSATLPKCFERFLRQDEHLGKDVRVLRYGEDFRDEGFEEQRLQAAERLRTEEPRTGGLETIIKEASSAFESYERVLVVLNTVRDCVEVAKELETEGFDPVVLHGKLATSHRSGRLDQLRKQRWLAVSTQVIEAGVDISALCLITDAAPPCALVQRAGRVLRSREDIGEDGRICVVADERALDGEAYRGIYDMGLVRASLEVLRDHHEQLIWHLPQAPGRLGYEGFIEECYHRASFSIKETTYLRAITWGFRKLLFHMVRINRVLNWLRKLHGSFVRDEPLIAGYINRPGLGVGDVAKLDELGDWRVPLSLTDLRGISEDGTVLALSPSEGFKELVVRELKIRGQAGLVERLLRGDLLGVLVPEDLYDEKYGLIIQR